ncbi:hypothetical protein EVAR_43385_1 [Eumeta japonica]|uniref:Uncharacterized protein n=1 Tax=Eumeta variegata TaxID=151549 RepID=A0A4C1WS08_EUMVA|nr:hypothetical protein EVAR_43385_1 [Eumeta japonica]
MPKLDRICRNYGSASDQTVSGSIVTTTGLHTPCLEEQCQTVGRGCFTALVTMVLNSPHPHHRIRVQSLECSLKPSVQRGGSGTGS